MEDHNLEREYYSDGNAARLLERKVADLFGQKAALWCPTGTMAQAIAARIYAERTGHKKLILHPTSHLLLHENDGYRHAHHLDAGPIGEWSSVITADLLKGNAACAFLELPQRHNGGLLPSWEQLSALKKKSLETGLALHLDGARIWSCRPYYGNRSYADITAGFSSIYVSLYKDIGAVGGAVLIGNKDFIAEAEVWRSRLGGLMIEPWPMICDALRLIDHRLGQMEAFVTRAREIASCLAQADHIMIEPEVPHTNMFHVRLPCTMRNAEIARDKVAEQTSIWLASRFWDLEGTDVCSMEMAVGEKAAAVPLGDIQKAVTMLASSIGA